MRCAVPLAPPMRNAPAPRQSRTPRTIPPASVLVEFEINLFHLN
jgi:hypothetical protein